MVVVLLIIPSFTGTTDADNDGLNRSIEREHGLDDTSVDTDGDGLNDTREFNDPLLDPTTNDTDSDGLLDDTELELGTNVTLPDTDGDGVRDGTEHRLGSDPRQKHSDDDGMPDGEEINAGTSPTNVDTDGDSLTDDTELTNKSLSPLSADTDDDGLSDSKELDLGTAPDRADTDGDTLNDAIEVDSKTSATKEDTDGDGLSDGVEAPPGEQTAFSPVDADTDGDGLGDRVEWEAGTDPSVSDTDGDGRSDKMEYRADDLDPTRKEVKVFEGSPDAGLNASLMNTTLGAMQFMADLPENETRRDAVVTETATKICDGHNEVVAGISENASGVSSETYRATYRVSHATQVIHDLGADIDPAVIRQRMETARKYSSVASKYAPVIGSYQRLHNASCAVKAGEPGAKQDFYIAAGEFTVDLALAEKQVMYKAAFKTTGYAAQKVGLMRVARVCGYKCVGLIESEMYWATKRTYSGVLDQIAIEATEGNLTVGGWNESVQKELGEYLETTTNTTRIGGQLVSDSQLVQCVEENLGLQTLWKVTTDISAEGIDAVKIILRKQRVPDNVDLSFLEKVESVNDCIQT